MSDCDPDDLGEWDNLANYLRKAAVDEEPVLLLCEQEDMWFGIARVDGEEDPRVFLSDAAVAARTGVGARLLAELDAVAPAPGGASGYAEEDAGTEFPLSEPAGDADIVADYGTTAEELLDLCSGGLLPADALTIIAERTGCADEFESVR